MATEILDKLLQTQFGKSLIMWFFLAMCAAIAFLGWYAHQQSKEIKYLNKELVKSERSFSTERERIIREQITFYQSMLQRLEAVERKKKR